MWCKVSGNSAGAVIGLLLDDWSGHLYNAWTVAIC